MTADLVLYLRSIDHSLARIADALDALAEERETQRDEREELARLLK